jgi:hypothetical protein
MALFNTQDLEKLLFGQLLEDNNDNSDKDDPQKELASFPELVHGPISNVSVAHDSLTSYLYLWSIQQLEQSSTETSQHRPLTTPVTTSDFVQNSILECDDDEEEDALVSNERSSRMKIMFRPPKRYLSYKEQKGLDKGIIPDRKGAKLDAWSPGGVEVIVETTHQENNTYQLSLSARRCGVDGDTVIKFSSERAIVRRLNEAVRIWKKVRDFRKRS